MKKMLLGIAVSAALAGCGGESLEEVKKESVVVIPASTVVFDPSNGVLSVPNDLLFSGTTDGTLNMPGEVDSEGNLLDVINYADPQTSLGGLDGWSTQSPFVIELDFPQNVSLDAASLQTPGSVRIFEVVMGASLTDETCSTVPAGIACKPVKELEFGPTKDFVAKASGNNIAVVPMKPLTGGASYIYVLTKGVKDSEGRSVTPSSSYSLVSQDITTLPLVTDAQLALQAAVNSYEGVVTALGSVTKDEIIYSAAMTIQSVGTSLSTVKGIMAANLQLNQDAVPKVVMNDGPDMTVADFFALGGMQDINPIFTAINYHQGKIALPIYNQQPVVDLAVLETLEGSQRAGYLQASLNNSRWKGMCDNAVTVAGYKSAVGDAYPSDPISQSDGVCAALSDGKLRDLGLDREKHLTKYNKIPKMQSMSNVDVIMTTPDSDLTLLNFVRSQRKLPPMAMPETGWPVVIYQHGITRDKKDVLALTAALSLQGFATIAIDHPMHGSRGIDFDDDGIDELNATDGQGGSVLHYMNLSSLLVARDNMRQSAADLLALRMGLNFINLTNANFPNINSLDVSFVGQSLGSVVAPMFLTHSNQSLGNAQVDAMFKVNTASLSSGGGGVASFLFESDEFGPSIQATVLSAAGIAESAEYIAFVQSVPQNCIQFAADPSAFAACAYTEFMISLQQQGEVTKLANIQSVFSKFIFAAQTGLDGADSTNYAASLKATGTPIRLSFVVGDGIEGGNKKDTVIPPYTSINPLAGPLVLANLLGMESVTETQVTEQPTSWVAKFLKGHHGSLLSAAPRLGAGATEEESMRANAEMQLQMSMYLATRGKMLYINDSEILTH
ncbi:VolA/Pla-1 family phospholipase [Pseudoalteromonas denitrificans]|uniref:Extracellular lipase, Pla-1/cef family n=1 Tax=Pseudoalteromonas denitrificans DSM 6059 TaxID=1123010 RepID=A0A1I1QTS1_9GAMM|nr:VolA/Pla-1 family phospholipase [Pseudoalteromonas denitrificans]SFD25511.1 extracellular lipase, Pla-1/cef family [Pseudoalteromonas denitrificans DSM 6059]